MKACSNILFDLDGTLIDSGPGIIKSVSYALEQMGLPIPENRQELGKFVGPPLHVSFAEFYGLPPEEVRRAITLYREYYARQGIWECTVYPGVPELLARLNQAGLRLLVATSKPERFAVPVLERRGLAKEFAFIAGADDDNGNRSEKHQVIRYALAACGIEDPASVLMVGDRKYDVAGAGACGIDTVGVLYGYGSTEELTAAGAVYLAETPEAVGDLLLGSAGGAAYRAYDRETGS